MLASLPFRSALSVGLRRTNRSWSAILLLYAVHVAAALPFALAFRSVLFAGAGSSLAPDAFLDGFDLSLAGDLLRNGGRPLNGLLAAVGPAALLLLVVNAVLSGGILASVHEGDDPATLASFLHACGTYAGRLIRLLVVALAAGLLVLAVLVVAGTALHELLTHDAPGEDVELQTAFGISTGVFLLLWVGYLCSEYARADLVVHNRTSILRALREGVVFVFLNPLRAALPYLAAPLVLGCAAVIYLVAESAVTASAPLTIALVFLFQQCFMAVRMIVRFTLGATVAASINGKRAGESYVPGWEFGTAD